MTFSKVALAAVLCVSSLSLARSPMQPDKRTMAGNALVDLIAAKTNADVNTQVDELTKQKMLPSLTPDVAFLHGGCGYVGCFSNYLVTVGYYRKSLNASSASIAAIVQVINGRTNIQKIFSQADISDLAK
ncbi:hypothetical protein K2X33_14615 [bacterium]|nr:hypothetical protein [bacterium]